MRPFWWLRLLIRARNHSQTLESLDRDVYIGSSQILVIMDGTISFISGYNLNDSLLPRGWRDTALRIQEPAAADCA